MPMIRSFVLIICSCLATYLPAQSLLEDSRRLLEAFRTMQQPNASSTEIDSAAQQALLILYLYDDPTQITPPQHIDAAWLMSQVRRNPLLGTLLSPQQDSLLRIHAPIDARRNPLWRQIQTPERYKISSLMYSDNAVSPSKYLSIRQSLQNNQVPPLQNTAAIRAVADKIQSPPSINALRTEAIIQGLFEFILERAEQEVAVSFFENLLDKKLPQVGFLFPNVRMQYSNPSITYSQSFLEGLREAFYLDLKNLNITLPELLLNDDYFGELQQEPVFYNLLTVYYIFALAHETPLEEVFPLVHRELYQRYETAGHNLNATLAATADTSAAYGKMVETVEQFTTLIRDVYVDLDDAEHQLEMKITQLKPSSGGLAPPDRSLYLANPLYSYEILLGSADTTAGLNLNLLPQFLRGYLDSATLVANNTFQFYDKFFDPPRTALHWKISGLELTRNLGGSWYNDLGITQILRRWQNDLSRYEIAVANWQATFDTLSVSQQIQATETDRKALQQVIVDMSAYWRDKAPKEALQPLIVLESIAADFNEIDFGGYTPAQVLRLRRDKLQQIEKRLKAFEYRLTEGKTYLAIGSPLKKYLLRNETIRPSEKVGAKIGKLDELLDQLTQDLQQLDRQNASRLKRAWVNTRPMLQLTEFMSHLLYVIQSPNGLMGLNTLDSALYEPELRQISMGLLQQRLSKIKDVGFVSPDAVAQFTRLTLEDLLNLQQTKDTTDAGKPKKQALFNSLSVALQSMNRILEFPLFANPDKSMAYQALVDRFPTLRPLPDVSERCMNFLYYLEKGEHRSAISSLLRLMTTLSRELEKTTSNEKRARLLHFFEEYGDFIAGMVDAKTKEQVEYLLKSLADPPGSSRTKRTHNITVGINAYAGVSAGREFWRESSTSTAGDEDFFVLSPTVPVGFAISKLVGSSWKHPQSFSLYLSLLDLGAMMTYRLSSTQYGQYKLTYKNVFKPGIQLHWNIQRTPFYLGVGWQMGAQFRESEDQELSFRSSRFFGAFGVDVPIKTLYQR